MPDTVALLAETLADYQSGLVLFVSACAFLLMFAVTYNLGRLLQHREHVRRRAFASPSPDAGGANDRRSLRHQRLSSTGRLLSSVAANLVPSNERSVSLVRRDLIQAGFFHPSAVAAYYGLRICLGLVLPAGAFATVRLSALELSNAHFLALMGLSAALGILLPRFYVGRRRKALQQQCRDGFPDFMDLMVVCAEAGISMDAAIQRVARELTPPYPYLGACLHLTSLELRAGCPLIDAIGNLADRIGIEEARNLGALLKQSQELGTSLSEALRVYSEEMRDKRLSRAEEKAHALPAKMAVPLTLFVFPVILVVILLPVFVRISNM